MIPAAPGRTGQRTSARAGWGYASGRVAVLEAMLLPRGFFEGLVASKNISEARSALGKTAYRAAFASDDAVRNYAALLDGFAAAWRGMILGDCPWHVMKSAWELPERYRAVRGAFLRKAAKGAAGKELAEALEGLASTREELAAFAIHRELATEKRFAGDVTATSMLLDSAAAGVMWAHSELAAEEKAAALLGDRAALQAWSSVLRAKWNGAADETIRRWFVLSGGLAGLVDATLASAGGDAGAALVGYTSRPTADFLRSRGREQLRQDLEKAMSEAVREAVLSCRRVAFGPERVMSYLVAFDVEETNLRIALAAIAENLDKAGAIARLRREYA